MDDVYEKLRQYLDEINPFGCPKTEDGAHLEFLKAIFSPEDAEVFVHLKLHPEPIVTIAGRIGKDAKETANTLDRMYKRGTILKHCEKDVISYAASVIGPGILEAVMVSADDDLVFKMGNYFRQFGDAIVKNKTGLLRTLPIEVEIPAESKAQSYERASEIIKNAEQPLAVIVCSCRKLARKAGAGCDRPMENCIVFGDHARFQIENGHGREIDAAEAQQILKQAEDAGLVHNIINFTDPEGASYLCNCCSCCCSTLASINRLFPEGVIKGLSPSNFMAQIDSDKCSGCEICIERCQIKALSMKDAISCANELRCIGCGQCVINCPEQAISLVRRPEDKIIKYPKTMDELYSTVRNELRTH